MAVELTIEQAKKQPANFMYVWADEKQFLAKLDSKTASIIRAKKANQNKVLYLSAEKYNKTYGDYTTAIRTAFINAYGMTPAKALVTLASGGEVAGKNWKEGVYGIGSVNRSNFYQDSTVTVDPTTGHIFHNGQDVTSTSGVVYGKVKGETIATNYTATIDGKTYTSQYNKTKKQYYAGSYSTADGVTQNANGQTTSASDSSSIWEAVILSMNEFLQWLISLFSGSSNSVETINSSNTLPSQSDGFTTETTTLSSTSGILIAAIAVGALLFGTKGKKKDSK